MDRIRFHHIGGEWLEYMAGRGRWPCADNAAGSHNIIKNSQTIAEKICLGQVSAQILNLTTPPKMDVAKLCWCKCASSKASASQDYPVRVSRSTLILSSDSESLPPS